MDILRIIKPRLAVTFIFHEILKRLVRPYINKRLIIRNMCQNLHKLLISRIFDTFLSSVFNNLKKINSQNVTTQHDSNYTILKRFICLKWILKKILHNTRFSVYLPCIAGHSLKRTTSINYVLTVDSWHLYSII